MISDLKIYLELVKNNFHKLWGFLILLILSLVFFTTIDGFIDKLIISNWRFLIYGAIILFEFIYWSYFKFHLPRNKKEKVGIVIAIYSKNEKERMELKDDFVSKIHKNFQEEKLLKTFHLIFLENHFAEQIKESEDPSIFVREINQKIKAHYFVWGEVKKKKDGDEKYFFDLNGYVTHKPIPKEVSQSIAIDFSRILPKKIEFIEKIQLKGFEISADFVYLSIKYIVGVAAFVSGDFILAEKLHSNLYQQFNKFRPLPPHLREIRTKAFNFFIDEKYLIAFNYYLQGQEQDIVKNNLNFVLKHIPKHYSALLLSSQLDFLDKNISESIKKVCRARDCASGNLVWRYNLAFLYFWTDKVDKALKICKQIRQQSYEGEDNTIKEVLVFNENLITKHPEKQQLYFWIGYLTYWKLNDLSNALIYFEKFNATADSSTLKTKGEIYLSEIERKMDLTK